MAGWVISVREVRYVRVVVEDSRVHGPRVLAPKLEVVNLPPEAWARLMQIPVTLPEHGAAPRCEVVGVLAWSITHLVDPLAAYYAAFEAPVRTYPPMHRGKREAA